MDEVMREIRRVASELVSRDKFPVVLGGEHSITAPVVAAVAAKHPGLVGAADRRARGPARVVHGHAAQPRVRDAARARVRARRRRSASAACRRKRPPPRRRCRPTIFYDFNMRRHDDWIDRVVDSLSETVYITIDVDGFDPGDHAGDGHARNRAGCRGTKALALLRRVIESTHASSAATSSSCRRCPATSRRISSAPS